MELAERELAALQTAGRSAAVVLADLDHFKSVNDTHGHAAGDAAIRAFAMACKGSLRRTDLVGRYGGEEFVIFLPGADEVAAEAITTEISRRLAAAPAPDGLEFPTVSYGISSTAISGSTLAQLIHTADGALYQAKAAGRNRAFKADGPLDAASAT
jgi:diguanylate cyclase (GGDEF)-like protein